MSSTALSGLKLDTYQVHESVGSGAFGTVYRATDMSNKVVALKVANEKVETSTNDRDGIFSIALALFSGGYNNINPVPSKLLELQCLRAKSAAEILPQTNGPYKTGDSNYVVMEFINGLTLRRLLHLNLKAGEHQVNDLDLAIKVFESLAALEQSSLGYHGDLKPENMIVSGSGVRLIDPGYYGALPCREGLIPKAVTTTPLYYPCLEPDDSFAAGAILWEICLAEHPLKSRSDEELNQLSQNQSTAFRAKLIGPTLKNMLNFQELLGRYFLSPINKLVLPRELYPQLPPEIGDLLLHSIGLEFSAGGVLERTSKAPRAKELLAQLRALKSSGVSVINPLRTNSPQFK